MSNHEVISAFIDNEPFNAELLIAALAEESGRQLLADLIALRALSQPDDRALILVPTRRSRVPLLAAAVVLLALMGGYQWGARWTARPDGPPAPTRVVKSAPWQELSRGGSQ